MQSRWDKEFSFIHISSEKNNSNNLEFGWITLLKVIFRIKNADVVIFHAQSALPYLAIAFLLKKVFNLQGRYVYDIHDLHEHSPEVNGSIKSFLRFYLFLTLEYFLLNVDQIKKITVSSGLARTMGARYSCKEPVVVRNISLSPTKPKIRARETQSDAIVFFGIRERVPIDAIPILESEGYHLHLYGRGIDHDWLSQEIASYDKKNIHCFGEYSPNDLSFLEKYRIALIYAPKDDSLNFKYSLPNKLFQSLAAGLTVLVSENFEEMISLFSDVPHAVVPVNLLNLAETIASVKSKGIVDGYLIQRKIEGIYFESRRNYLNVVGG